MNYGFRLRIENLSKYIQNKKKKVKAFVLTRLKPKKELMGWMCKKQTA